MTEPAHPHSDRELEHLVAARTADLTEMLAYLAACWDEEKRLLARAESGGALLRMTLPREAHAA